MLHSEISKNGPIALALCHIESQCDAIGLNASH